MRYCVTHPQVCGIAVTHPRVCGDDLDDVVSLVSEDASMEPERTIDARLEMFRYLETILKFETTVFVIMIFIHRFF